MKNKPFGYRWAVLFLWKESRAYLRSFGRWQCALFGLYSNPEDAQKGQVQCQNYGLGQNSDTFRAVTVYDEHPEQDSIDHLKQTALNTLSLCP